MCGEGRGQHIGHEHCLHKNIYDVDVPDHRGWANMHLVTILHPHSHSCAHPNPHPHSHPRVGLVRTIALTPAHIFIPINTKLKAHTGNMIFTLGRW